jgi:hypothetical protein
MKQLALILAISTILGCSAIGALKGATSMLGGGNGPSLEVETTIGDKEEIIHTEVGTKVDQKQQQATVINNTTEEFDPTILIVLVLFSTLGWVLPQPSAMWNGITKLWGNKK